MKKHYVSTSQASVRMFRSSWMEALSKVHFTVPLILYVPVVLFLLWNALFIVGISIGACLAFFGLGLFLWTLVEYVMHRWVFHYEPSSGWGRRLHYIFHGVHHAYPNDEKRLVLPPSTSIPLAALLYCFFSVLLSGAGLYVFFAAFLLGYLFYDISHYALHHFSFKNPFWRKLKHHHMLHHYSDATKGYGVSSAFWDKVFGSDFHKE
ncbi:sterol desaturase family protein [Cesiribacter sp. SM1]|uniref:sterol desaturase family protein n=1 Tax=Cesiribacter sp. SM1 TaxID=2861196 RepID=UPI001CD74573|nr:sterol desaturase family protein [Cesiribacter sp. SM1]